MENSKNRKYTQKRDKRKCSNYRGISLLSSAYKIYTTITKSKLHPIAEEILQKEQCGFRKADPV
jgi:hypothetical protein